VKTDSGENVPMRMGEPDRRVTRSEVQGRDQYALHVGIPGALDDFFAVRVELVEIEVAMCVGKHNQTKIVKIITDMPDIIRIDCGKDRAIAFENIPSGIIGV
jgi:hypothetical protein